MASFEEIYPRKILDEIQPHVDMLKEKYINDNTCISPKNIDKNKEINSIMNCKIDDTIKTSNCDDMTKKNTFRKGYFIDCCKNRKIIHIKNKALITCDKIIKLYIIRSIVGNRSHYAYNLVIEYECESSALKTEIFLDNAHEGGNIIKEIMKLYILDQE